MSESVQRQVVLPWAQVMRISFNSMKARLFRSLITTLTLALAIAFAAHIRAGYDILSAVWPHAESPLRDSILASGYEISKGQFGGTPKDLWLAMLSLLVCVVGIVNAQLMAVTERFREIGTFKCLGALNSYVVRIFLLEAAYQGLLGGVVGGVFGILAATLSFVFKLGWIAIAHWPVGAMLVTVGGASLLAVALSLLGVAYPALVASRMPPAVALRTEQ